MDGGETSATRVVVLAVADVPLVVGRLVDAPPDLDLVDALARLQLEARRRGWTIRLQNPSAELSAVLDLVGLAEVLGAGGSALEPRRQAERGEELGVQEVVQPGDPAV